MDRIYFKSFLCDRVTHSYTHTLADAATTGAAAWRGRHNGIRGTNTVAATMHWRINIHYYARVSTPGGIHRETATGGAWPRTRGRQISGEMTCIRAAHDGALADAHTNEFGRHGGAGARTPGAEREQQTRQQATECGRAPNTTHEGEGEWGREGRVATSREGEREGVRTSCDSRRALQD